MAPTLDGKSKMSRVNSDSVFYVVIKFRVQFGHALSLKIINSDEN